MTDKTAAKCPWSFELICSEMITHMLKMLNLKKLVRFRRSFRKKLNQNLNFKDYAYTARVHVYTYSVGD
jgi:hypothetical protein